MFDISPRKGPGDVTWRVATKLEDARTLSLSGPGCAIKLCAKFEVNSVPLSQRFSRKLSEKMLFNKQERKKPRLKFNSVSALIGPSNNRALTTPEGGQMM